MIDRRDITGLSFAAAGHAALVALIYYWPWHEETPPPPPPEPIQVTLADDIGLVSAAPDPSDEPPAQAQQGEDAPPDPDPEPPAATPEPATKPDPTPPRTNPDAAPSKPPSSPKSNAQTSGAGRRRPGLQIDDFSPNNGPAAEKTDGKGSKSEATMTGEAQANIVSAIVRQVKPCADRQVIPAPEARQILAVVQLRLNRDGSFAGLKILRHEGVNDTNERYVGRVDDAVEAIFAGCTPIRNLPPELYDVPRGWRSITFRYRLTN